jgi:hypothetical protein
LVAHAVPIGAASISTPGLPTGNTDIRGADTRVFVSWDKEMVCNGLVLQFEGNPGRTGAPGEQRVRVLYQSQLLWCDVMEIELDQKVMFFEPSPAEPRAVGIKFSRDVVIQNRQFDAQGRQTSMDFARVQHLHYNLETDHFSADGPGEIRSVFLGSGQGFDRHVAGHARNQDNGDGLNFLGVWFSDTMNGLLLGNNRNVDIRGRVVAVYCPVTSWEDTISRENIAAARRIGYILDCEQLLIVEVPDPMNLSQSAMELTAAIDAQIDGGGMNGTAQKIMYNQAKDTIQLDGNVRLETMIQGQRVTHPRAESIRYNIATGTFEVIRARGGNIGR